MNIMRSGVYSTASIFKRQGLIKGFILLKCTTFRIWLSDSKEVKLVNIAKNKLKKKKKKELITLIFNCPYLRINIFDKWPI